MCGIAGAVGIADRAVVEHMTTLMAYRGPDGSGIYQDGDACLGHRRLSILDLSSDASQPMESDDGRLVITYNGEIYNFRQLRATLEARGYRFRSASDTEVILYAYDCYGLAFLEHLQGMFALALWDRGNKQLVLARDRAGIKPLFYHRQPGGIAFASELKPMLLVPGVARAVSRAALRSVMRYAGNFEDESMVASVYKLRPGHLLVWRDGVIDCRPYWQHPGPRPDLRDEGDAVPKLRRQLQESVQSHLVSDVPVGAALSGGLDSSAIVALLAQTAGGNVDTFTMGDGHDDPDLINARIVAEHCRTNHHEIVTEAASAADLLPRVVWFLEEPLAFPETVQMYVNYREAARLVKVLLIGEGADECFAGYSRYKLLHPQLPVPAAMKQDLYGRAYMFADEEPRHLAARMVSQAAFGRVAASPMLDPVPRTAMPMFNGQASQYVEQAMYHDYNTFLPHTSLKRADGLGMAHSLELRVPYLDRGVVELAARIPAKLLIRNGYEKHVLRKAVEPLLPPSIVWRRKRPFQVRLSSGLSETLDYLCDRLLQPSAVRERGFFDPARIHALRRARPSRLTLSMSRNLWSWRIWCVLMCEVWARLFLDRPLTSEPPATLADIL